VSQLSPSDGFFLTAVMANARLVAPAFSQLRASAIARRRMEEEGAEAFFLCERRRGGGFKARCASSSKKLCTTSQTS
jgi:hypothetical protein